MVGEKGFFQDFRVWQSWAWKEERSTTVDVCHQGTQTHRGLNWDFSSSSRSGLAGGGNTQRCTDLQIFPGQMACGIRCYIWICESSWGQIRAFGTQAGAELWNLGNSPGVWSQSGLLLSRHGEAKGHQGDCLERRRRCVGWRLSHWPNPTMQDAPGLIPDFLKTRSGGLPVDQRLRRDWEGPRNLIVEVGAICALGWGDPQRTKAARAALSATPQSFYSWEMEL